jgi:hypothetical protein
MADERNLLETLRFELKFLQDGGYGRSPHAAWRPPLLFEDSPTCLNFAEPERPHPCEECFLIHFVPEDRRNLESPCRHIPLDEKGQTLDSLYRTATQQELEEVYGNWLRRMIARLEQQEQKQQPGKKENIA